MSKFEDRIAEILVKDKIRFTREKTFDDLRHGRFRYDFYCIINNKPVIIECNGRQHYERVPMFQKTESQFRVYKEHDRRKISYALANGIPMYIIPFWDEMRIYNMKDILQPKYRPKNRWHNDEKWDEFKN